LFVLKTQGIAVLLGELIVWQILTRNKAFLVRLQVTELATQHQATP
jgi:hypothetical protein